MRLWKVSFFFFLALVSLTVGAPVCVFSFSLTDSLDVLADATGALGSLLGIAKGPVLQSAGGPGTSRRDSGVGEGCRGEIFVLFLCVSLADTFLFALCFSGEDVDVPAFVGYWSETLHSLCQEAGGLLLCFLT